ncbi:MAG: S9 family peptidase [Crocinitomicaceae bacterium]|nr:S9 family peptidase [Crocinitomicaceae bacterium]|tara:strand:+ start:2417 stop:4609 length:2193 start_codon:yes stop_codon:yes gene_type:complete
MIKKTLFSILLCCSCVFYSQSELSNELIWQTGAFYPNTISGIESMNDGENYTSIDRFENAIEINQYSYKNNKKIKTIFSSNEFKDFSFNDYSFSEDENFILLSTNVESIYRHSSKGNYYIYDVKENTLSKLTDFSLGKQRLAKFSPDGTKIAFVRNNNLFYVILESMKEFQVTIDGEINNIINGATDWVYEEEFSFHKGFYWSPDSKKIAYYKFDESNVKEYQMEMYGTLYPTHYKFKYPKAGESNSIISINVYNILQERTIPFDIGLNPDIYIPRITWGKDNDNLYVVKLNRLQNQLEILAGNFSNTIPNSQGVSTKVIYEEKSDTYIDVHDNMEFISDEEFIWTSEKNGFNHIYIINYIKQTENQLTSGKWEVTSVYGLNNKTNQLYFQAAKNHPTQREIYSVNLETKSLKCISSKSGTNEAEFSNNFKYFINTNTTANTPHYITLNKSDGKEIRVIEDNQNLVKRMDNYNLFQKEFITVPNGKGLDLNAWVIKDPKLDTLKKHPLLMFVYGGPGINTVNDSWSWMNYFWFQYLAKQGFVVVSVDARGTGYRGRDFKHSTYLQLGKFETEDQIAAAKYFGSKNYIDEKNIGIFGWSYGGYMSSLCITKGADVFSTAIAVAPVTNWRFYDNIYTERFMRTPQENGSNYDVNSPINHVDKLKGNYLLIHGTADDNVHFQNAIEMTTALVNANKQFDLFNYPDKNHGIYGGNTRLHLYTLMTNFLNNNLND